MGESKPEQKSPQVRSPSCTDWRDIHPWYAKLARSGYQRPCALRDHVREMRQELRLSDHTKVILFADLQVLPSYTPRQSLQPPAHAEHVGVSLISTIRNEATQINSWLASLKRQSRLPDELVITDGGSTDGSVELLRELAQEYPIPIRIIKAPGANIARGRNLAIQHARHEIIACTDFGCTLDEHWLRNLIMPFEVEPKIDLSCGFFEEAAGAQFEHLAANYLIPKLETINPSEFLPSSRSIAFRKQVWERVAGYPEWLSLAGEDTLFDIHARMHESWWAFVPQAIVYWHAPTNLRSLYQTQHRYSKGDGEAGLFASKYWQKTAKLILTIALLAVTSTLLLALVITRGGVVAAGALIILVLVGVCCVLGQKTYIPPYCKKIVISVVVKTAQVLGFHSGVRNRSSVSVELAKKYASELDQILLAHPSRSGVILFPPYRDWDQADQQLRELVDSKTLSGYLCFYCTLNQSTDDVIGFRQIEKNLYLSYVPPETFSILQQPAIYPVCHWHLQMLDQFSKPTLLSDTQG